MCIRAYDIAAQAPSSLYWSHRHTPISHAPSCPSSTQVPVKFMSAFSASKYALAGFTEAVRAEVEPLGAHRAGD